MIRSSRLLQVAHDLRPRVSENDSALVSLYNILCCVQLNGEHSSCFNFPSNTLLDLVPNCTDDGVDCSLPFLHKDRLMDGISYFSRYNRSCILSSRHHTFQGELLVPKCYHDQRTSHLRYMRLLSSFPCNLFLS